MPFYRENKTLEYNNYIMNYYNIKILIEKNTCTKVFLSI